MISQTDQFCNKIQNKHIINLIIDIEKKTVLECNKDKNKLITEGKEEHSGDLYIRIYGM